MIHSRKLTGKSFVRVLELLIITPDCFSKTMLNSFSLISEEYESSIVAKEGLFYLQGKPISFEIEPSVFQPLIFLPKLQQVGFN